MCVCVCLSRLTSSQPPTQTNCARRVRPLSPSQSSVLSVFLPHKARSLPPYNEGLRSLEGPGLASSVSPLCSPHPPLSSFPLPPTKHEFSFFFFFFFQFQVREKRRWGFFLFFSPERVFRCAQHGICTLPPPFPTSRIQTGKDSLYRGIEVKFAAERQNDRGARRTQRRARDREERSPRRGGARGRGARRGPLSSSPDPHFLSV